MHKNSQTVRKLTIFSLFLAIELILFFTPLGFIRLGVISATLMHIPVIVAAILLGTKEGALLGLVFGLCSVINATMAPGVTSFVFSPFVTIGGVSGNWTSLVIAIVPRVLLGVIAGTLFRFLEKRGLSRSVSAGIAGAAATVCHTFMVLGLIYILFGQSYAAAANTTYDLLLGVMGITVLTNGIPEAVCAGAVSMALAKAIRQKTLQTA